MSPREPIDIRAARKTLGLSVEGLRVLLRMGENSGKTIRRWQSGEQDVPGPVAAFLELLVRLPAARQVADVDELARRYPAFTPGRPEEDCDMVTVYNFRAWDQVRGEHIIPPLKSPVARIKEAGGMILPDTAEEVPRSSLDEHGRYNPRRT